MFDWQVWTGIIWKAPSIYYFELLLFRHQQLDLHQETPLKWHWFQNKLEMATWIIIMYERDTLNVLFFFYIYNNIIKKLSLDPNLIISNIVPFTNTYFDFTYPFSHSIKLSALAYRKTVFCLFCFLFVFFMSKMHLNIFLFIDWSVENWASGLYWHMTQSVGKISSCFILIAIWIMSKDQCREPNDACNAF